MKDVRKRDNIMARFSPNTYYQYLVNRYGVRRYIFPEMSDEFVDRFFTEREVSQSFRRAMMERSSSRKESDMINDELQKLLEIVPKKHQQLFKNRIFVGEFPTGDFNAHAVRVPEGSGYVILVNVGLIMFIYAVAEIIFSQIEFGTVKYNNNGKPIVDKVLGTREISYEEAGVYFQDTIQRYVNLKRYDPSKEKIIVKGGAKLVLLSKLGSAAVNFVLAHELGHLLLGHLDSEQTRLVTVPGIGIKVPVISKSWENEFKADLIGGFLFVKNLLNKVDDGFTGPDSKNSIGGPFLFFELLRLIEKAQGLAKYTSHPPTKQRYEALETHLMSIVPQNSFSISKRIVSLLQSFEPLVKKKP